MRTDRTHYTVPGREAYDIELYPPPPGLIVNCFSCWGVQTKGLPDKFTIAWSPLDKIPASAKRRALQMVKSVPKPVWKDFECTCGQAHEPAGPTHVEGCFYHVPF